MHQVGSIMVEPTKHFVSFMHTVQLTTTMMTLQRNIRITRTAPSESSQERTARQ